MDSGSPCIALLASDAPSTRIIYHRLKREFGDVQLILESRRSRYELFRRRLRRLGPLKAVGQAIFVATVMPILHRRAVRRIAAIKREYNLDDGPLGAGAVCISSVNSTEARRVLADLAPQVVIVSGTRIISAETLAAVDAPFINMHAGITPQYRGVHGAYWALADGAATLVGTTVHIVDAGVDTGPVIAQKTFKVSPDDSIATYGYLHVAAGLQVLVDAVRDAQRGILRPRGSISAAPSRVWSHPTVWGYLAGRVTKGVR
jgi:phosphoribosylglycinamide formyltransferase-1